MEEPNTIGINHKPTPELIVPYWIDGLGSSWESALHSEAERTALVLTEGNRLNLQDIHDGGEASSLNAGSAVRG